MTTLEIELALAKAAASIAEADALLICAGAGMGIDSGLPDFRGKEGFWRAYPPFARLNLNFEDVASPEWFHKDPALAWGFYGHRLHRYREAVPHDGYTLLRQWAEAKPEGHFVFTSNVDGHFAVAGFVPERIAECHGSIHHLQCAMPCCRDIWEATDVTVVVEERTMRAVPPLPACPNCGGVARPNILMFGDWYWFAQRSEVQDNRLEAWLRSLHQRRVRLTIVECGAGCTIPTVRWFAERESSPAYATLIRINPQDHRVPAGGIALPLGARDALHRIDTFLHG